MEILDIFNNDAFSMASMSEAIQKVPTVPEKLASLNLFTPMPIRTSSFGIEIKENGLTLIPFSERGEPLSQKTHGKRKIITFQTNRLAKSDKLLASDIQFVRQFGTEDQMIKAVMEEIALRQTGPGGLLDDLNTTKEYHRLNAIFGKVLDADGSVIEDYFDSFGIDHPVQLALDLANTSDGNLRFKIEQNITIPMRQSAKGAKFNKIYAMCGHVAWLNLGLNPEFRETYLAQLQGQELRDGTLDKTYSFAGCEWFPYFGTDDDTVSVADDEVVFFPGGQNNTIFREVLSPGERFDHIAQLGQPVYSQVIVDEKRQTHADIEVFSYPKYINTRPEMIKKARSGA